MKYLLLLLLPGLAVAATDPGEDTGPFFLPAFPKPDPIHAFADMKTYSAPGRVWRQPEEDWSGARRRISADPVWAKWLSDRRAEVDDWMSKCRDRVEWTAGWGHEFVSPLDGSFLTWTTAVPGKEVAFLSSPSDPHVSITPKIFRGWVLNFRGRHAVKIHDAARLWRLTGDVHYAEWAAGQLDFYAAHLDEWALRNIHYGPSRLTEQPLDEASVLIQLTEATRLLSDWVAPARRQMWFERLFLPEAELLNQSMHRIHNIACWQRSATAQVALLYNDPALWRTAVDGPWGLRQQLECGVTSDYLWFEQSSAYNEFAAQAFVSFFTAAAMAGRGPSLANEMAIGENLFLAPDFLRFPNGALPNPADNSRLRYAPLANTLLEAYRVLPTPLGLAIARKTRTWETLIDPPAAASGAPPTLPLVVSHDFQSTRFALLRAGGWQVFFHYGQLTASHAQAEALNFEAYYGDRAVTTDPGTVGYGSPLHKGYYSRGLAQNVLLLNGEGEVPAQPGDLLNFDSIHATVTAAQPFYCPGARAQRNLRIEGNRLIDTATITTTDGKAQLLGLALHLQGHAVLPAGFVPAPDFAADRPEPFRYWRDVVVATFRGHAEFRMVYPDGFMLQITFAVPGEFRIFYGSAPDAPPARNEAFYIETKGTKAIFTTDFTPLGLRP
ncbi:MAG: heparinase II/III family protein [Opitutaceae bacterium]